MIEKSLSEHFTEDALVLNPCLQCCHFHYFLLKANICRFFLLFVYICLL